jgi:GNAT superfamily N-acetyltransferase
MSPPSTAMRIEERRHTPTDLRSDHLSRRSSRRKNGPTVWPSCSLSKCRFGRVLLRSGTPADAEAVARVQIASWQAAYAHLFSVEQLGAIPLAERTSFWERFPPIVAEVDGEVVGFVAAGDRELYAIYVHPDHWGTGVGRELIHAGEAKLRALGNTAVFLWVFEDNPQARHFYEAAGWSTDGETNEAEQFGMSAPVVRYTKTL